MKMTILIMSQGELEELFDSNRIRIFTRQNGNTLSEIDSFEEPHSDFNDCIPGNLPNNSTIAVKCARGNNYVCCFQATELPSKWIRKCGNSFACFKFIDQLFILKSHRAYNFCMGNGWLKMNHHAVFWIAAFNHCKTSKQLPYKDNHSFNDLSFNQKC